MRKLPVLLLLLFITNCMMAQNTNAFAVQATTANGIIEGNYNTHNGIQTYFGVPFAKPPVGALLVLPSTPRLG